MTLLLLTKRQRKDTRIQFNSNSAASIVTVILLTGGTPNAGLAYLLMLRGVG